MASTSASDDPDISSKGVEELRSLLWGSDVKHDVFRRWTQGIFTYCQLIIAHVPCPFTDPDSSDSPL